MKIIKKQVNKGCEEYPVFETRYFAESDDGFDGTAQGYGYKSIEKINKAYWFFKNKDKINLNKKDAKKFLKLNQDVKECLSKYFSCENHVFAFKNGEKLSFENLIYLLKNDGKFELIKKLNDVKHLWKILYNTHYD